MSNTAIIESAGEWYLGVYCRRCRAPIPVFHDPEHRAVAGGTGKLTVACPRCRKKSQYAADEMMSFLVYADRVLTAERAAVNDDQPLSGDATGAASDTDGTDDVLELGPELAVGDDDDEPGDEPETDAALEDDLADSLEDGAEAVLELGPELAVDDDDEPIDGEATDDAEAASVLEPEPDAALEDDSEPALELESDSALEEEPEPILELDPDLILDDEDDTEEALAVAPDALIENDEEAALELAFENAEPESDMAPVADPEPAPAQDRDAAPPVELDPEPEPEPEPDIGLTTEAAVALEAGPVADAGPVLERAPATEEPFAALAVTEAPSETPSEAAVDPAPVAESPVAEQSVAEASVRASLADDFLLDWAAVGEPAAAAATPAEPHVAEAAPPPVPVAQAPVRASPVDDFLLDWAAVGEPPSAAAAPAVAEVPTPAVAPVAFEPSSPEPAIPAPVALEPVVPEPVAPEPVIPQPIVPEPVAVAPAPKPPTPKPHAATPSAPKPIAQVYRERWGDPANRPRVITELRPLIRGLKARAEASDYDVLVRVTDLFLDYLAHVAPERQSGAAIEQYIHAVFALSARGRARGTDRIGEEMAATLRALNRHAGLYIGR